MLVDCFSLIFLQELRELQELQKLLYTFLHVMASNDLSYVFIAPNCRQHLDAVMQFLLYTSYSHKDMQLRKVNMQCVCLFSSLIEDHMHIFMDNLFAGMCANIYQTYKRLVW